MLSPEQLEKLAPSARAIVMQLYEDYEILRKEHAELEGRFEETAVAADKVATELAEEKAKRHTVQVSNPEVADVFNRTVQLNQIFSSISGKPCFTNFGINSNHSMRIRVNIKLRKDVTKNWSYEINLESMERIPTDALMDRITASFTTAVRDMLKDSCKATPSPSNFESNVSKMLKHQIALKGLNHIKIRNVKAGNVEGEYMVCANLKHDSKSTMFTDRFAIWSKHTKDASVSDVVDILMDELIHNVRYLEAITDKSTRIKAGMSSYLLGWDLVDIHYNQKMNPDPIPSLGEKAFVTSGVSFEFEYHLRNPEGKTLAGLVPVSGMHFNENLDGVIYDKIIESAIIRIQDYYGQEPFSEIASKAVASTEVPDLKIDIRADNKELNKKVSDLQTEAEKARKFLKEAGVGTRAIIEQNREQAKHD